MPLGRLAAWIGGLGAVAVALAALLASMGEVLDGAARLQARLSGRAAPPAANAAPPLTGTAPATTSAPQATTSAAAMTTSAAPTTAGAPPAASTAAPPSSPRPGAGLGTFVRAGTAPEGAWLAARLRRTLELEGIQLAAEAGAARNLVDLSPPALELVEPAPAGAPLPFGADILLEARILAPGDEAHPLAVVQRKARGLGATPAEATQRARLAAADLLGLRLAEALQSH